MSIRLITGGVMGGGDQARIIFLSASGTKSAMPSIALAVRPMPGAAPPVRSHAWAPKSLMTSLHKDALSTRSGIYPRGWGDILTHVLEPEQQERQVICPPFATQWVLSQRRRIPREDGRDNSHEAITPVVGKGFGDSLAYASQNRLSSS